MGDQPVSLYGNGLRPSLQVALGGVEFGVDGAEYRNVVPDAVRGQLAGEQPTVQAAGRFQELPALAFGGNRVGRIGLGAGEGVGGFDHRASVVPGWFGFSALDGVPLAEGEREVLAEPRLQWIECDEVPAFHGVLRVRRPGHRVAEVLRA